MAFRLGLAAGALAVVAPLAAQETDAAPPAPPASSPAQAPPVTAEQALAKAKTVYGPPPPPPQIPAECEDRQKAAPEGEIVVCAPLEEQSQFRVPSSLDEGSTAGDPTDIRAPDLAPKYPGMVVARGCFIGPCPKEMPPIIDLKAIPEAPPGSDADRIAKGEKRGD